MNNIEFVAAPRWAAGVIVLLLVIASCAGIYLLIRKLFGKKRYKKGKGNKDFKGVDLLHGTKEVGLHGRAV